jgi:assimilatory nitrate reductase catalytic subunit
MLSGRVADEREELPDRQVRPPRVAHREPRLQRPLLHGVGRGRQQEGARHRPGVRTRGATSRWPTWCGPLAPTSPRPSRSPPATSGGPATAGAKLIVQDPRVVPLARTADLFLPVRPGHRLGAVRGGAARVDPPRLARPRLHRRPHRRLRRRRRSGGRHDPGLGGRGHRGPAARIEEAAELWGTAATGMLLHARGIEQHTKGVDNVLGRSTSGWPPASSASPDAGSPPSPARATAKAAASTATSATNSRATVTSPTPSTERTWRRCGGATSPRSPARASRPLEIIEAIHDGEIKGLLSICFNPLVSAPDSNFTAEALDKLEFYAVIDFFLSESATTPTSSCPARSTRRTRAPRPAARADHQDQRRGRTPGRGPPRLADPRRHRRRLGKGEYFPYTEHRTDLRRAPPRVRRRHRRLHAEPPGNASRTRRAVLADPRSRPPGHPPPVRRRQVLPPRRPARFHAVPYKPPAEVVDDDYPVWLTTGRVVSQYLSGTQTRRIAALVAQYPEPLCEMHPASPRRLGVADGDLVTVTSRRGDDHPARHVVTTIRPDTVFIPYHWPGDKAANQLTQRGVDPISRRCPSSRSPPCASKAGGQRTTDVRDFEAGWPMRGHPLRHRRLGRCS